ncbi:permease prefix domain 1-containing protein [Actinomyces sp. MRS3W]|uniref:permease prefix domain 1-containing protein n=1 Tax=Actinomyces sp. MRS3W TaxID=2800796 RepID=UPI0028FD879C|nr:permease prefix domain 1-containing protein [Actinomyces sp. MRS3W]MDU0347458.1 permease prefix domain 1-containing protein [Actinomyces sp. MRS3W]
MDTINTFLEAMFAPYPATARLLEAKCELQAMMEDAYADAVASGKSHNEAVGSVITDFGNLEELAPVLGILPDIRSAGAQGSTDSAADAEAASGTGPTEYPTVTLPQAQALAEARRNTATMLGNGVALCVLAAVPLFLALGLSRPDNHAGITQLSEDQATAIGIPITLIMVAAAVALLIRRHRAFTGLTHLIEGQFTRDPLVSAWAARLRLEHEPARSRALAIAVGLWIVSPIPLLSAAFLFENSDLDNASLLGLVLSLIMVAAGLKIYLPAAWAAMTHETITDKGRPADAPPTWQNPKDMPFTEAIAGPYWTICVVIFLASSFVSSEWGITWMIWPIAAVLFAAIAAGEAGWRSWRSR